MRREIDIFGGPCVRIGWSVLIGEPADSNAPSTRGSRAMMLTATCLLARATFLTEKSELGQ